MISSTFLSFFQLLATSWPYVIIAKFCHHFINRKNIISGSTLILHFLINENCITTMLKFQGNRTILLMLYATGISFKKSMEGTPELSLFLLHIYWRKHFMMIMIIENESRKWFTILIFASIKLMAVAWDKSHVACPGPLLMFRAVFGSWRT